MPMQAARVATQMAVMQPTKIWWGVNFNWASLLWTPARATIPNPWRLAMGKSWRLRGGMM